MSESEIPHETPGSDGAAGPIAAPAVADSPQPGAAEPTQGSPAHRKLIWAAVALLCTAAGVVGSVLGAHAVANSDSSKGRQSAQQSAAAVAATVKLSLRHEEDIAVGAATYFAGNSKTSPKEFAAWVKWARTLRRFPELNGLSLLTLVHPSELAAFQARLAGQKLKPVAPAPVTHTSSSSTATTTAAASATSTPARAPVKPARPALRVIPATNHAYYCLAVANLVRGPAKAPRAGTDYCALTPGLLLTRDSGQSTYRTVSVDGTQALAIDVPVYRGNVTPHSVFGRTAASVGWLREVLAPSVMLREALRGHEASAVSIAYQTGSSSLAFASGSAQPGSQSTTLALPNGWTVQSFSAVAGTSVLHDGPALALLIVGCVLSVLLGLLIFVLGGGRTPLMVRVRVRQAPAERRARRKPA